MEPDPTVEPIPTDEAPARESPLSAVVLGPAASQVAAETARILVDDPIEDDANAPDGSPATEEREGGMLSALAAYLTADRAAFVAALDDAIAPRLSPPVRRALRLGRLGAFPEAEVRADNTIAIVLSDEDDQSAAVAVCAALAARNVARALHDAEGSLEPADCGTLLAACSDAAQTLATAQGAEGLRTLLPIARSLARRVAGRGEPVRAIAGVIRHVAARIAADPALVRALAASTAPGRAPRPRRGMPGPPRRIVLQGPVEIAFHPR